MDNDELVIAELDSEREAVKRYLDSLLIVPEAAAASVPLQEPEPPAPAVASGPPNAPPPAEPPATQARLSMMHFRVGRMSLAIPSDKFAGIQSLQGEVNPLPQAPEWVLGLLEDSRKTVIIDTYQLVGQPGGAAAGKQLLMFAKGSFGLLCDEILGAESVAHAAVRWSGAQRKRPWLAGIHSEARCAIIDLEALLTSLRSK